MAVFSRPGGASIPLTRLLDALQRARTQNFGADPRVLTAFDSTSEQTAVNGDALLALESSDSGIFTIGSSIVGGSDLVGG
jgi:hypothetical protein